jgi:hypothetical protein
VPQQLADGGHPGANGTSDDASLCRWTVGRPLAMHKHPGR